MSESIVHDFLMKTLERMKNRLDEYQVRKYALTWYDKGVLDDNSLATVDKWYSAEETVTDNVIEQEEGE